MIADATTRKEGIAIMMREIRGKFTVWKKGERVYARRIPGIGISVKKLKPTGRMVLMNECCDIPPSAIAFCDQT